MTDAECQKCSRCPTAFGRFLQHALLDILQRTPHCQGFMSPHIFVIICVYLLFSDLQLCQLWLVNVSCPTHHRIYTHLLTHISEGNGHTLLYVFFLVRMDNQQKMRKMRWQCQHNFNTNTQTLFLCHRHSFSSPLSLSVSLSCLFTLCQNA